MDIVSKINGDTLADTEFNQIPIELEALQTSSGQTSSDAILNQVSIATSRYSANNFYIDSGTANAYLLSLASSMTNPVSATVGYFVGMTIFFRAGNANTGASTVNVNSAGVKNLKKEDGTTDLQANDIPTNQDSIFRYNGTVFVLQNKFSYQLKTIQTFTASGTWTRPAGCRAYMVFGVGGGGQGGSAANTSAISTGSGGGSFAQKWVTSPNSSEIVTIGQGGSTGTATNNGQNGGTTSFGSIITCGGGTGGKNADTLGAGAGGIASGGDINIPGGGGSLGRTANQNNGGGGSAGGGFGAAGGAIGYSAAPGNNYGGGGGGSNAAQAGGIGANGIIIVHEYY